MATYQDGPASPLFQPIALRGKLKLSELADEPILTEMMRANTQHAPHGDCVCWGIPFKVGKIYLAAEKPIEFKLGDGKNRAPWLVFMHTTDWEPEPVNEHGFVTAPQGPGLLKEHVADYVFIYADGTEVRQPIRRRFQINMFERPWGENGILCVPHVSPRPIQPLHELFQRRVDYPMPSWGQTQTRTVNLDLLPWVNWLWAWENPHPRKALRALRIEPIRGRVILSAISSGKVQAHPLRWETRRKAIVKLPRGREFDPVMDADGTFKHARIDLGSVICQIPRRIYPNDRWTRTYERQMPETTFEEIFIEYTAHPEARLHLEDGKTVKVATLAEGKRSGRVEPVKPAARRVEIKVTEKGSTRPVPVRLHVHGEAGEYLAPVDRHRIPNSSWFEDYGPESTNSDVHWSTYIDGETRIDLPLGNVYIEVSKGLEIRPIRKRFKVGPKTESIEIELERVLPWRERGWVTADTHVHFISPTTAMLEGSAEGVNVINLLASQWGELMTNVGDFDGKNTWGSREAGGDGEWLVRVGSENRQHVLGHISLLGYNGRLIAPMCSGGADEAALGDPVEVLLTQWAEQCRRQGGLVVMPHMPQPRLENAATFTSGNADAVEMCSWGNHYMGINPYSLSDWYRYLNCGYFLPLVGGTDKMGANIAVGTIRTYARLPKGVEFSYDRWKEAVRAGNTFATYGPLMELSVDGKTPGEWIEMKRDGGTVDVSWKLASVTWPMTRVELVVNGEIRESRAVNRWNAEGAWRVKLERSSWLALLVRGHYEDQPEVIAAHSSPVMARVAGSPFFAAADALTILDQIEGALAYLDTIGTRAEESIRKQMRLVLTREYNRLHGELHQRGVFHDHTHATDHKEHHH